MGVIIDEFEVVAEPAPEAQEGAGARDGESKAPKGPHNPLEVQEILRRRQIMDLRVLAH